jgi:ABC-type multidrug transport system fused ATPase/permease subunit
MPRSIIQIYQLFFWRQPNKLFTLIVVTALMSLAQITSVALIMPFVRLIFSPHEAMENDTINGIYSYLNFSSLESFTLFVGAAVLLALILSNAFLALGTWYMARFTWQSQLLLSSKLLRKYLQYDYESFTGLNSADIQKNILFESAQVTTGTLMPLLNLIAYGITALLITSFLLWVDSNITLGLAAGLGLSYWVAYLAVKGPLQDSGAKRIAANSKRYKVVNEAFGGLKEIKILALEEDCEHRFFEAAKEFSTANVLQSTASQIPRYAIESIALCVLVGGLLVIAQTGQNLASVLPTVSAFALGAFRLLPALQKVFNSISTIRFNISALQTVHALHQRNQQAIPAPNSDSLPTFRQQIQLESVCYSYPNADTESIKSVSLTIRSGQLVALVGSTGAGKSTIADILMGLLPPSSGRLTVDGN